jgi:hypothetical protein
VITLSKVINHLYQRVCLAAVAGLLMTAGCRQPAPVEKTLPEPPDVETLQARINQLEAENQELLTHVQGSSRFPAQKQAPYIIQDIKITKYTGFYDKDGDGHKEKLIVYFRPVDDMGDAVKARGAVDVQLWDLNEDVEQARLGQWMIGPEELSRMWFATFIKIHYRLIFDIPQGIEGREGPFTVKVMFKDAFSGRPFQKQISIDAP